jgi:hypothetical protein
MTVTVYKSTDASAPTINVGGIGLGNILQKCLCAGYGSQSAAGWTDKTSTFSAGTNQFVFQQGTGSNGFYLQIDDSATAGGNTVARTVMFETMSTYNTGTNMTPSTAQLSGGMYVPRGNGATVGSPQRWCVIATAKRFYMWLEGDSTNGTSGQQIMWAFGDIQSNRSGDGYATVMQAYGTSTYTSTGSISTVVNGMTGNAQTGTYCMRRWDQLSSGIQVFQIGDGSKGTIPIAGSIMGASGMAYPNPEDGGVYLSPVWIGESVVNNAGSLRGVVPGLWHACHNLFNGGAGNQIMQTYDSWSGTGALAGKTFAAFRIYQGLMVLETSNTW